MPSEKINIVVAGDSIGYGLVSHSDPWAELNIQAPYKVENHSLGGATLSDLIKYFEGAILNDIDSKLNSGDNWLIIQAATNDLAQGRSANDIYKDAEKLTADAHNAGFKVLIATVLPRDGTIFSWSSASESTRNQYNELLRHGAAGADAIADIAADPTMGSSEAPKNPSLYSDFLHPTAAAVKTYLEPIYSAAISKELYLAPDNGLPSEVPVTGSPSPVSGTQPSGTPIVSSPVPSSSSMSVGSGADQLLLKISEFVYKDDAQFTVSVDGKQIGGTLTAHAAYTAGQSDLVSVRGDWSQGDHTISLNLLANAADPSRQIFLNGATYNDVSVSGSTYSVMPGAANHFVVHDTSSTGTSSSANPSSPVSGTQPSGTPIVSSPVPSSSSMSVGSGADQLLLKISEFVYKDDAQFTVSVDGKQIGGTLTAHAAYTAGQSDLVSVRGDWSQGDHTISLNLLANAADPSRQIFLNGATYNDVSVSGSTYSVMPGAANHFVVHDTSSTGTSSSANPSSPVSGTQPSGTPIVSSPVPSSSSMSVGSGADQLLLKISEFVYKDDAQFTVSVDGKQIGGTLTAHAAYTAGQSDLVSVRGDWSQGDHTISLNLLANAADPSRQIFLNGATYNDVSVSGSTYSVMPGAANHFVVHDTSSTGTSSSANPSSPVSGTQPSGTPIVSSPVPSSSSMSVGSGADQLLLKISEFVYKDDAQFTVSVDGKQIGGTLTAHAAYTAGQSDLVSVRGDWSQGDHTISLNLLANAADPSRQIFLNGATYNDVSVSGSTYSVMPGAANHFVVHDTSSTGTSSSANPSSPVSGTQPSGTPIVSSPVPSSSSMSVGSGADQLLLKISEFVYKDDAQFTVSVDGKQIGGTLTAHAAYTAGQSDLVSVRGDWSQGDHTISLNLLANAADPSRQIFLNGATYNDVSVSGSTYSVMPGAANHFVVHDTSSTGTSSSANPSSPVSGTQPSGTPIVSSPVPSSSSMSVGSGADQLLLKISEFVYKDDAQFTVSVDGKQIGGTLTAHAAYTAGQSDLVSVRGDWSQGDHTISLNLLANAADPSRQIFLNGATYNDVSVSGSTYSVMPGAANHFVVHDLQDVFLY